MREKGEKIAELLLENMVRNPNQFFFLMKKILIAGTECNPQRSKSAL